MSNWRTDLKTYFADMSNAAIPDIKYFGAFNSQKNNPDIEETKPCLGIYFEYSLIGNGVEYLLQNNLQQAARVPIVVSLHIMFSTFNDQSQDCAYEYAEALTCEIIGKKHELIHGQISKAAEDEDTSHRAVYEYVISFGFVLKEAVFLSVDEENKDVNPVDASNPETGRRLKVLVNPSLIK